MPFENEPKRIAIEKESDWVRAKANIQEALDTTAAQRLPRDARVALREEVHSRLEKLMEDAWKMMIPNLQINGHNYEDYLELTEAFDHHLDHRLHGLAREAVEVDAGILELRRKVPADINDFEETLALVREQCEWTSPEEDPNEADSPAQSKASHAGANQSGTADALPPRHDETVQTYRKTLANLNEVLKNAPGQIARAERANFVRETVASVAP